MASLLGALGDIHGDFATVGQIMRRHRDVHHRFSDQVVEGGRSIGLELVSAAYLLIDPGTLDCERVPTAPAGHPAAS